MNPSQILAEARTSLQGPRDKQWLMAQEMKALIVAGATIIDFGIPSGGEEIIEVSYEGVVFQAIGTPASYGATEKNRRRDGGGRRWWS